MKQFPSIIKEQSNPSNTRRRGEKEDLQRYLNNPVTTMNYD